jgi:hypothetical protein
MDIHQLTASSQKTYPNFKTSLIYSTSTHFKFLFSYTKQELEYPTGKMVDRRTREKLKKKKKKRRRNLMRQYLCIDEESQEGKKRWK